MSKAYKRKTPAQLRATELRRVNKIKDYWEKKGFLVVTNQQFRSGVDIMIIDIQPATFGLLRVIESTNWNPRCYLKNSRYVRYLKALNRYAPTPREIVFSFESNLSKAQKQGFQKAGIIVTIKGYQD